MKSAKGIGPLRRISSLSRASNAGGVMPAPLVVMVYWIAKDCEQLIEVSLAEPGVQRELYRASSGSDPSAA